MGGNTSIDELLNRSFQLAYFILGDRTAAIYVAMAAMDKVRISSLAQDRRLYYMPTGRSAYPAARTKVILSETHLLQRQVYVESEPFERLIEGQGYAIHQEDMIIRFIKHLVRVTTKNNSFYVALGMCRLLYNYTTAETSEIYNFLVQDPDRARDDYYYRSRKKHLMEEIKSRFGNTVQTYKSSRGEERFRAQEDVEGYVGLVRDCLNRFTPWESPCVVSTDIDPERNIVAPLLFKGKDPDDEHKVELNRIHTLLHPDCFERLTNVLGLAAPAQRLNVPQFFISGGGRGMTGSRYKPAALSEGELEAIRRYVDKNAALRKNAVGGPFSVFVDGKDRVHWEGSRTTSVSVDVGEGSEWIEVRAVESDEDIPLARHPVTHGDAKILPSRADVLLEGGQRLTFSVDPLQDSAGEPAGARVHISYAEAGRFTRGSALWARLRLWLSAGLYPQYREGLGVGKLAFGFLLVTVSITGLLIYLQSRPTAPDEGQIATGRKEGGPDGPVVTPGHSPPSQDQPRPDHPEGKPDAPRPGELPRRGGQESPSSASGQPDTSSPGAEDDDLTRGRRAGPPPAMLLAVKKVYVDAFGEEPLGRQVREELVDRLRASNRFVVVDKRSDADAVFKGSVRAAGGGASIVIRLVNVKGQVIWPTASERPGRKYSGAVQEVTQRVLGDLLSDVRKREEKR